MPFRTKVIKNEYHLQYKGVFFWSTVDFNYRLPNVLSKRPIRRFKVIYKHQYDCNIAEGYANDGYITNVISDYKHIIDKRYL